jgi:hypothetical protein
MRTVVRKGNRMTEEFNDGFAGSQNSRLIKDVRVRWNDTKHWHDGDGLAVPLEMLLLEVREVLQRWKDGRAEIIDTQPLPRPDELNSKIPVNEWELGFEGKPRPPWEREFVFYLINLATGESYTFASTTYGARLAYDHICDAVANMRALRGAKIWPLVHLSERPMKTNHGRRTRPHLEIVGWKSPGEVGPALSTPPTPQAGPIPSSTASSSTVHSPTPQPTQPTSSPTTRQPKSSINFTANDTLAAMRDINPVSTADKLNDENPWE